METLDLTLVLLTCFVIILGAVIGICATVASEFKRRRERDWRD